MTLAFTERKWIMTRCGSQFKIFRELKEGIQRELDEDGQKAQTSGYKTNKCRDVMYNVVAVVNTAVSYI